MLIREFPTLCSRLVPTPRARRTVVAVVATLMAILWLKAVPATTPTVFIANAARLVSLLTGTPAIPTDLGWLLPFSPQAAMVTEACAATDFFVILTALLGWHLGGVWRGPIAIVATLVMAVPLTLAINALRIIAVTQAHRWVIPLLPPAYEAFLHLLTGVAVFLPALIGLNLLLEFLHGRLHPASPVRA